MSVRSSELQCAVIDEFRRVPPRDEVDRVLWEELLRTSRSLANNSAESDGSQSRKDFILKFHLCLKEARECLQLLNAVRHASPARRTQIEQLRKACDEIVAILVSSLKTAKAHEEADMRNRRRP